MVTNNSGITPAVPTVQTNRPRYEQISFEAQRVYAALKNISIADTRDDMTDDIYFEQAKRIDEEIRKIRKDQETFIIEALNQPATMIVNILRGTIARVEPTSLSLLYTHKELSAALGCSCCDETAKRGLSQ